MAVVAMEIEDCAFSLLRAIIITTDIGCAFEDADVAFMIGGRARGPGMQRRDLLELNASIYMEQGKIVNSTGK